MHIFLSAALIATGLISVAATPAAAAPVGAGFTVTPSDLAHILRQIKIAEAHSAALASGTNPDPVGDPYYCQAMLGNGPNQLPTPLVSFGLRTVSGECNNLIEGQSGFGASHQLFPRLTNSLFRDAEGRPADFFGPGDPGSASSSYKQKSGLVFDSQPRTISNLIVDQTSTNPAAISAAGFPVRTQGNEGVVPCTTEPTIPGGTDGLPVGCVPAHQTLFIPNVTTDVGLSPPFNSMFTIFGQFFDHGVDQTVKAGGTVFVPLKDDDPLITLGPDGIAGSGDEVPEGQRFMVLTRARNQPGPDGILGDPDPAAPDTSLDDIQDATNTDSPFVDQSQTYTSDESHQVFLREYAFTAGRPVATGKLISSADGGQATWGQLKADVATFLGLQLLDKDVTDVPMLAADPYGKFIPGPARGMPQYVCNGNCVVGGNPTGSPLLEGDPAADAGRGVLVPDNVRHIDIPFLTDIAHSADPSGGKRADANLTAGLQLDTPVCDPVGPDCYDNELLESHFMAGDGRVNENIALTAVHQIFHSEHDRLVDYIKNVLVNDTSVKGIAALPEWQLATGADGWNGERLFQAARFVTEMEYQHLVFEEFARKVQPGINPFEPFALNQTDINSAVVAEFAHAVYRFGHSMLTETIARTNEDGATNDIPLLDGFLNPNAYHDDGSGPDTLTSEQAAGSIFMGMSDQTGNEIDEFVTETLRNNLLGLPLDLPTINMTRARSEGIPPLNRVRQQLFASTNDGQLEPYANWVDFGLGLKHPESLVNFVAAYGTHPSITSATTAADKREAARILVDPGPLDLPPADAADFMFSESSPGCTPTVDCWANTQPGNHNITGLDEVDLWVGGLAERTNLFGGLLGSTFNYVFETQLTNLQNGDRLYYLARTPGMNLRAQLESNSFAELVMRNTSAHSLKADAFATADCKFELGRLTWPAAPGSTITGAGSVNDDPLSECDENLLLIRAGNGRIRYRTTNQVDPAGINGQAVYNGTTGIDRIFGGVDNDTFLGNESGDIIEGNDGADVALGGDGDDVVTDLAGDDVLKGGPGDDALDAGPGLDLILGGEGNDFSNGGANSNETFGAEGNDFAMAGQGLDAIFGGTGDDWEEGGDMPDLLIGDSSTFFFTDFDKPGHDVFFGQGGDDDYDSEGGDDILVAGPGVEKNAGSAGYDWSIGLMDPQPQNADLALPIVGEVVPVIEVRDRFNEVEALSGWNLNDHLVGDDVIPSQVGGGGFIGCDAIDQASLDRISGLDALVPPLTVPTASVLATTVTHDCPLTGPFVWGEGNIIIGGAGSDLIEGRGADDIIDGDRYMNVRLSIRTDPADAATEIGSTDLMNHQAVTGTFGDGTAGMTLQQAVFARTAAGEQLVDPGNIVIVREILTPVEVVPGVDTAVFSDVLANYTITVGPGGSLTVASNGGADGIDTVRNVEFLQFADTTVSTSQFTNNPATGTPTTSTANPQVGVALTAGTLGIADLDGLGTFSFQWQANGLNIPGATAASFTPAAAQVGATLRVVVSFTDGAGNAEQLFSDDTAPVVTPPNNPATGSPILSTTTPQVGVAVTVNTAGIADLDGLGPFSFQWRAGTGNIAGATGSSFTPTPAQFGLRLRVVVSFTDGAGHLEQRVSAATSPVAAAAGPVVSLDKPELRFGGTPVNTSVAKNFRITNNGPGNLVVANATSSSARFTVNLGTCANPVAAGGRCRLTITFTPTALGRFTGILTITSNAQNGPVTANLIGRGI